VRRSIRQADNGLDAMQSCLKSVGQAAGKLAIGGGSQVSPPPPPSLPAAGF
jgi:hypothetical protein